jgi:hypothetical protein
MVSGACVMVVRILTSFFVEDAGIEDVEMLMFLLRGHLELCLLCLWTTENPTLVTRDLEKYFISYCEVTGK